MCGGARIEVPVAGVGWLSVDAGGVEGGVERAVVPEAGGIVASGTTGW
jgi:hypothetical protein